MNVMPHELYYTSAQAGLRPGTFGYCTVAATRGLPEPLLERLEALSGYRAVFSPGDPRAGNNPVAHNHWIVPAGGRTYHVLSRVAFAGFDYTGRTNKFAHHVALSGGETPPSGPAWLLGAPGVMETEWTGEPRLVEPRRLPRDPAPARPCAAWAERAGDAGWAGVVAEALAKNAPPVCLVFAPGMNMLPLAAEALSLLPAAKRWSVSFSTYLTDLPKGVDCRLRCCLKGSPLAAAGGRAGSGLHLDLTLPLGKAPESEWSAAARSGRQVESDPAPAAASRSAMDRMHSPATAPVIDFSSKTMRPGIVADNEGGLHELPPEVIELPTVPTLPRTARASYYPRRRHSRANRPPSAVLPAIAAAAAFALMFFLVLPQLRNMFSRLKPPESGKAPPGESGDPNNEAAAAPSEVYANPENAAVDAGGAGSPSAAGAEPAATAESGKAPPGESGDPNNEAAAAPSEVSANPENAAADAGGAGSPSAAGAEPAAAMESEKAPPGESGQPDGDTLDIPSALSPAKGDESETASAAETRPASAHFPENTEKAESLEFKKANDKGEFVAELPLQAGTLKSGPPLEFTAASKELSERSEQFCARGAGETGDGLPAYVLFLKAKDYGKSRLSPLAIAPMPLSRYDIERTDSHLRIHPLREIKGVPLTEKELNDLELYICLNTEKSVSDIATASGHDVNSPFWTTANKWEIASEEAEKKLVELDKLKKDAEEAEAEAEKDKNNKKQRAAADDRWKEYNKAGGDEALNKANHDKKLARRNWDSLSESIAAMEKHPIVVRVKDVRESAASKPTDAYFILCLRRPQKTVWWPYVGRKSNGN